MNIFFSVGEPSGDLHGANLIEQLRRRQPSIQTVGYGGPRMAAAGCQLHEDLTHLAVMWFLRVFTNLHRFLGLVSRADRFFRHHRPDAVVLIDYPGLNWWIARRAKAHGIPVFYYGTPQIWAWAPWRVRKIRRLADHLLCKLPFEEAWFRRHGCRATYVGHPYFDELQQRQLDRHFIESYHRPARRLITILPGSRMQEVVNNLRWLLRAAEAIAREVPGVRFAVASYRDDQAKMARRIADQCGVEVDVWVGRTPELIHLADCCLACSGSVSLELLYHAKPAVILYWINTAAYFVQALLRRARYITLVNLLAGGDIDTGRRSGNRPDFREAMTESRLSNTPNASDELPYPEYLTCEDKSEAIASHAIRWLTDERLRQRKIDQLVALRQKFVHGGASLRAAEYILNHCQPPAGQLPRPHFLPRSEDLAAERSWTPANQPRSAA